MKKVIIRTDASTSIGSGHVMRCLTIAENLRKHGCEVYFWMEALPGNLIEMVQKENYSTVTAPEQADLYIIDHYALGEKWESEHRKYTKKIVVIDDLANREHDCDLLLDQNVVPNYESRYDKLVPQHCVKLLGAQYLIMRDEFIEAREKLRPSSLQVERLLVFMGGMDPTHETMKVLQALESVNIAYVDVVVGNGNPQKEQIQKICQQRGYHYHQQINYMASLMQQADFSIGAGGSTMWERCYVGLPSSATIVADNQRITTEYAESLGAVQNLGWHEEVIVQDYKNLLENIQMNTINRLQLSEVGLDLTQGKTLNAWLSKVLELLA